MKAPPPTRIKVKAEAFLLGTAKAHQCGPVLYVSSELFDVLTVVSAERRHEILQGLEITMWPALSGGA